MMEVGMDTGKINWASPEMERMFGYWLPGELEGQLVEVLVPEALRKKHADTHRPGFAVSPRQRMMGSRSALMGARQDGTTFPVEIVLIPRAVAGIRVVVVVVLDMTDRHEE